MWARRIYGASVEEGMTWNAVVEQSKILDIMDHLVGENAEIKVFISGYEESFTSCLLTFDREKALSRSRKGAELIIEKLSPDQGNALIQISQELVLEFPAQGNLCRCSVEYLGISSEYPYFGYILRVPDVIEIKEKRREERFTYETPDFVTVEFTLRGSKGRGKVYELKVLNCSLHGLGVLITEKDLDLRKRLRRGDKLDGMTLYAESSMIKVDGTVRHVTKVSEGQHAGCYVLGIESEEIIENCRLVQP
jgi:hypothetical protein